MVLRWLPSFLLTNSKPKLPEKKGWGGKVHLDVFFFCHQPESPFPEAPQQSSLMSYWLELQQMLRAKPLIVKENGNCHNWLRSELSNPGFKNLFHIFWKELFPLAFWLSDIIKIGKVF